ncbi:MAG: DEAD/DEAH box helicase [Pseudomonadota bacterium]
MSDFESLGLRPAILKALAFAELTTPTPIQARCIPLALEGHDIMGLAQTGTGKTMAFALPLIHNLLAEHGKPGPRIVKSLILAPTRELVNQIADNIRAVIKKTPLRLVTVVGGVSINKQITRLGQGTDVLVATPGRLIDLMDRGAVDMSSARFLVLDEADQMLDMGFIHALRRIAPALGTPRQTMLFSATMPKLMEELSQAYLTNPQKVQVAPPGKTADKIEQSVEFMGKDGKATRLRELLRDHADELTLVFSRTKYGAEKMMKALRKDGFAADSVHGNKSQGQRDRAIAAFRSGEIKVLVATDVAARGIDIPGVALVVNYDLPNVPESYVHRIGRTARAGREGIAVSFCAPDEQAYLKDIEKLLKRKIPGSEEFKGPSLAPPAAKPRRRRGPQGPAGGGQHQGKPQGRGGKPQGKTGPKPANSNKSRRRRSGGRKSAA